jgi:alpha-L-fucosidase
MMAATRKGNKINLLLFQTKSTQFVVPAVEGRKVIKAKWMNGLGIEFKQTASTITLTLPAAMPDPNCSVIVLEMDGQVENLPLIKNIQQ